MKTAVKAGVLDVLREMGPPVPADIIAEYRAKKPAFADSLVALNREWQHGIDAGDPHAALVTLYNAANMPLILVAEIQMGMYAPGQGPRG